MGGDGPHLVLDGLKNDVAAETVLGAVERLADVGGQRLPIEYASVHLPPSQAVQAGDAMDVRESHPF